MLLFKTFSGGSSLVSKRRVLVVLCIQVLLHSVVVGRISNDSLQSGFIYIN